MSDVRITQHQNGFLKVALPGDWRAHVWSPWNPPTKHAAPAHGHPFDFFSFVMAGEMTNVIHEVSGGDTHAEMTTMCVSSFGKAEPVSEPSRTVSLRETRRDIIRRGECYSMRAGEIHETRAVFAITLFKKLAQHGCHAPVFAPLASLPSREQFIPPSEALLKISLDRALAEGGLTIEDVISVTEKLSIFSAGALEMMSRRRAEVTGYHEIEIPRSHHGSVLKVLEEAFELADADAQGANIMSMCECADLLSALRAYSRRLGVTFSDVELMSQITDRVFACGARSPRQN